MRYLSTSLTLAGFTVVAGLAGCGSDATTPSGSSGASGGAALAGAGPGSAGKPNTPTAGSGSGGAPVVGGAGASPTAGSGNNTSSAGSSSGGTSSAGSPSGGTSSGGSNTGGSSKGGTTGTAGGGNPAAGGPSDVDQMGKSNAKPGAMASTKFDYLKLGEIRILNNNWGSVASGCTTPMSVFVNADKSFGWSFDRGACNGSGEKPDFPQLEFGIHPFGLGSADATSPNFSSTTLLPLQIKDITSASVKLTDLKIEFEPGKQGKWDLTFEFWLSSKDPGKTQGDAGVYAELMTFWGWETNRWPDTDGTGTTLVRNCNPMPCKSMGGEQVTAGKSYKLFVQDDMWSKWRYFQFRDTSGSHQSFPGDFTVDVKKLIDHLVSKGYSKDLWVARLEVGSEIDDNNKGKVTMKNVEFEVNGQKRSPVFGQ